LQVGAFTRKEWVDAPTSSSQLSAPLYSSTGASGTAARNAATHPRQTDHTGAKSLPATSNETLRSTEPCARKEYESCAFGNVSCVTSQAPASRDCSSCLDERRPPPPDDRVAYNRNSMHPARISEPLQPRHPTEYISTNPDPSQYPSTSSARNPRRSPRDPLFVPEHRSSTHPAPAP
jgi:hypothetical protein